MQPATRSLGEAPLVQPWPSPLLIGIGLDAKGQVYWNTKPISLAQLSEYLARAHRMEPEPEIILETQMGAPCGKLEAVRDLIDERLECSKSRRCNEGILKIWNAVPAPPGALPS